MTEGQPPPLPGSGTRDSLAWLVRISVRRPYYVLAVWALVVFFCAVGIARLKIDTTTASFLDREDPAWWIYQDSLDQFGGDEFLTIALEGDEPFDRRTLEKVYDLSERLEALPDVRRVDSLRTVPIVDARPDGAVHLDPPLLHGVPDSAEGLNRLVEKVREDRIAPKSLVSPDERVFAINVLFDEDVDGRRDVAVAEAERLVGNENAWISGVPVFRTKVNDQTRTELLFFVPLTLLVVGVVVFWGFRRVWSVVIALGTAGVGTLLALGAMGAMATPISLSTFILPSILLALGCAYAMHVLMAARGMETAAELEGAIMQVARPVAMSGLTTAIGFLAMATVRVSAIRELATFGAIGVVGVTAASLTFAPVLLRIRSLDAATGGVDRWGGGRFQLWLVRFVSARRGAIAAFWVGMTVLFGVGLSRLDIETDIILWFPKGTEVRDSYEAIRERLSGITPMNVVIRSVEGKAVTEPHVVAAANALTEHLESMPEVGRALSMADPLRQMNEGFSGDSEIGLPDSRELAEQYLLLLSSVEQVQDVVSEDRQSANVLLRVNVNGSRRLLEVGKAVEEWWAENGPSGFVVDTTGIMYEFGRAEEEIAYGQIRGLGFAFMAIGVILLAMLRAPVAALGALAPNALPIVAAYGFMGLAGISLDSATVCLGCIALGIAVDDTIHIVTGYRSHRDDGESYSDALSSTFRRVLPPVVLTTIAISAGFIVLGVSDFTLVRNFGFVTAGMVIVCLLADLTLLPVLLAGDRGSAGSQVGGRESAP